MFYNNRAFYFYCLGAPVPKQKLAKVFQEFCAEAKEGANRGNTDSIIDVENIVKLKYKGQVINPDYKLTIILDVHRKK